MNTLDYQEQTLRRDNGLMKRTCDLSILAWTLSGYTPHLWRFENACGTMAPAKAVDVGPVPARVPGSVQAALRQAGIIPDWNLGLNSRLCEWVENRHWIYRAAIPDDWFDGRSTYRLNCLGLDYSGWVFVNGREAATFQGTHVPHVFDVTGFLKDRGNEVEIVFDVPPRWLGQFGYTSRMTEWKTRFNYTWDWVPRLVQVGIWDSITLEAVKSGEIRSLRCLADADLKSDAGRLELGGDVVADGQSKVQVALERNGVALRKAEFTTDQFRQGVAWDDLPVELWWPNLEGNQPLYTVTCRLVDDEGVEQDSVFRRVGFRHVDWVPCEGAPCEADPWVCVVNGRPVFLQGVNFAPIRANYADLTRADYETRLNVYRDLGCNMLRINACGFLEKEWFYDLCDELGLMVWQEFPLTSSGIENWPPEDETSIGEMERIARSFIERRRHHVSLTLWSGGNELQGDLEGNKTGTGKPCSPDHPMLKRLAALVGQLDSGRRFIHTSPSGPRACAAADDFGKGLHWDVHGPWNAFGNMQEAQRYWSADDALFRSELGCPGASPVEQIEKYAGGLPVFPATADSPFWSHPTRWWIDWPRLVAAHGREPRDLAEYVAWSQASQAEVLCAGMKACKARFPRCGGVLLWTGHDTSPIPINTSILDYEGRPKPAALALAEVWRSPAPRTAGGGQTCDS